MNDVAPGRRFEGPLFHRDGTLLLLAHMKFDDIIARALKEAGIETIFICTAPAAAEELRKTCGRREIDVKSLPDGKPVKSSLYNEAGELVCSHGLALSDSILGEMARQGEIKLFEGDPEYEPLRENYERALALAVVDALENKDDSYSSMLRITPGREPFSASCARPLPSERFADGVEEEKRSHAMCLAGTHGLLERARREGRIDLLAAQDIAEEILYRCARDLPLTIALADTPMHHEYLVDHALSVAIHAVAMGCGLGYDRGQCGELALAGLLHDVGMTKISDAVIKKQDPLTPAEVAEIRTHPDAGLELLKHAPGISLTLPFAVFHDHERTDGRGYPRGLRDGGIHDHAKVIALADAYQAMTAARPYKPRRGKHRAVLQLLRMVQEEVLDSGVIKAFLYTHGVYPIGSWVKLSDDSIGRVVDARREAYDKPLVSVLIGADGEHLSIPLVIDLSKKAEAGEHDDAVMRLKGRSATVMVKPESLYIEEAVDGSSLMYDFAAGFHLAAPETKTIEEGEEPELRPAGDSAPAGKRSVPPRFLDWSASFSGFLTDFSVLDLVQIIDVSQKSGIITLKFPQALGEIRFAEGEILNAEFTSSDGDALNDESAIFRMMEYTEGTFVFEQRAVERRKTVKSNNTMILMEGCRLQDERQKPPDAE